MINLTLTSKQYSILQLALASSICTGVQSLKSYEEAEPRYSQQLQYVTERKALRTLLTDAKKGISNDTINIKVL